MYCCIGRSEEEIEGTDNSEVIKGNRQYIYLSMICLIPNVLVLIFGIKIILSASNPPPTHELEGIGIKGNNYCYWLVLITYILSGIIGYNL